MHSCLFVNRTVILHFANQFSGIVLQKFVTVTYMTCNDSFRKSLTDMLTAVLSIDEKQ